MTQPGERERLIQKSYTWAIMPEGIQWKWKDAAVKLLEADGVELAAYRELFNATKAYANDYMQDEADEQHWVCGAEQRDAAKRVFAAIATPTLADEKGGKK